MNTKIVLAAVQPRFNKLVPLIKDLKEVSVFQIQDKSDLTDERLSEIQPDYIFFPQWNWVIPADIHRKFNCVMFHMTDLPYGRGGSPLQNLIVQGKSETMLSAFKCDDGIDTGPVYLKKPLSLDGTAEDIFSRSVPLLAEMIKEIVLNDMEPVPQAGEATYFKRRKPEDGDISILNKASVVYDYIRMLDAEGYPNAFLETECFRFEFSNARLEDGEVSADVRIKLK